MQQWSKDFIQGQLEEKALLRYLQQSFALYSGYGYFMHPVAHELCRVKALEGNDSYPFFVTKADLIVNDNNWCNYLPIRGTWSTFRASVNHLCRCSAKGSLFYVYGGY